MDEFGHILREARETKGLTLAEVQQEIRINVNFLAALEEGDYDSLPTPVHVRGYLRNYARFLGLDPEPLVNRYERVARGETPAPLPPTNGNNDLSEDVLLPPRQDQPFFNPVNVEVYDGRQRSSESILRLVIILALVVAVGLVINRFLPILTGSGDESEQLTEGINAVIQDITNNQNGEAAEAAVPTTALTPSVTPEGTDVIISTSRNNTAEEAVPTASPTWPPLPATLETVQLKLEITERTWMEVTIDGDVVFTGIARRGDPPYEWEAQEEAKVVTGNAIGIFVTINDQPMGRLGGRGENQEYIWRTTN